MLSTSTVRWRKLQRRMPSARARSTQTTQRSRPVTGAPRRGSTWTAWMIGPATGAPRQGPPRCPPRAGAASPSRPTTKMYQAGTISPSRAEMRSRAPAQTTSLTTRRRERPSGHARLEQQLGEEDCAGVVCWQKPPGRTRIRRRCCRFFTGWCNKRRRLSVSQEADGRVAAPPSLNGLVRGIVQRGVQQV